MQAGLPPGILNVVNGDKEAVDTLLTDQAHQAQSALSARRRSREYIYATGTAHGKRVQCFGGAKNHMIVMPDADMDQAVDALIGAGYGSAGERCMAISVAVPVGEKTADTSGEKTYSAGRKPQDRTLDRPAGRLRSDGHPARTWKKCGATSISASRKAPNSVVDGRNFKLQGYEKGNFMGGCLFDHVTPQMQIYKEEIFGPFCRSCAPRTTRRRSGCRLNTNTATASRSLPAMAIPPATFVNRVQVGMVGVNFAIPVPLSYYTRSVAGSGLASAISISTALTRSGSTPDQDRHRALAFRHQGRRRVHDSDDALTDDKPIIDVHRTDITQIRTDEGPIINVRVSTLLLRPVRQFLSRRADAQPDGRRLEADLGRLFRRRDSAHAAIPQRHQRDGRSACAGA